MTDRMEDEAWNKLEPAHAAYCQNCDWQGHDMDLDPIGDIHERTEEGDTVWAGDCPECGAMCFTVAEINKQVQETHQKQAASDLLRRLQVVADLCEEGEGALSETKLTELALARAAIAAAEAAGIKVTL